MKGDARVHRVLVDAELHVSRIVPQIAISVVAAIALRVRNSNCFFCERHQGNDASHLLKSK